MNDPLRSAVMLSLMMGGLGMIALGIQISNKQHGLTMAGLGAGILMTTGLMALMLGMVMCLSDIIIYGYR